MDKDALKRGAAVFGSCYIKRWLEPRYDQLVDLPVMAKLRAANVGSKHAIEAILYSLTAFAENKMADTSPLGLMIKAVLMDAAPEISARLLKDARADLNAASTAPAQPEQSVASRLLALDDADLLGLLISIEDMDAQTRAKFLPFAAKASDDELRRFASLTPDHRSTLLGMHSDPQGAGSAADSFKSFMKDFWAVVKAGSQKTAEVGLPTLNRYLVALLQVLKTSAALLAVALLVCTASTQCGRWSLFVVVLGILGASVGMAYVGKQTQKSWLSVAGVASGAVMAVLALIVASGYSDAVFALGVFFLVGLPTLAVVAALIPATAVSEILRKIFPEGHRTLVRAFQMLLAAFFGVAVFSVVLLVFPPQNPVAFLFIVPAVLVTAIVVGIGLTRIRPEEFLRTPVILGLGSVMLVTMGVMSMPNLRQSMRKLPARLDLTMVDAPMPVTFSSSSDIDFVNTKDGEVRIWFAEKPGGGYDLFRCDGVGPYYAKDGRQLAKADSESIRRKIGVWVDLEARRRAEALRRAEQLSKQQRAEEQKRADAEAIQKAEALRRSEQERAEQDRLARERKAEEQKRADERLAEQRKAAQVLADNQRRNGYMLSRSVPSRVDFVVCAATATRVPMDTFAAALAKHLKSRGKTTSTTVFSPEFVADGAFDSFFSGRGGADLQSMPLSNMGGKILLARIRVNSVRPGTSAAGLFSASVVVAFSIISSNDGSVSDRFEIEGVGPGTSEADATSRALDRILDQLSQHGY